MQIVCPWCEMSYPVERTCLIGKANQAFTIICEACDRPFDGFFEEAPGAPATTLYRWSFGLLGQPAITPETSAVTKKRIEL